MTCDVLLGLSSLNMEMEEKDSPTRAVPSTSPDGKKGGVEDSGSSACVILDTELCETVSNQVACLKEQNGRSWRGGTGIRVLKVGYASRHVKTIVNQLPSE